MKNIRNADIFKFSTIKKENQTKRDKANPQKQPLLSQPLFFKANATTIKGSFGILRNFGLKTIKEQ